MANDKNGVVDISSNKQIKKLYNKKGRVLRIISAVLSVILLLTGSGLIYYYTVLNSMTFDSLGAKGAGNDQDATASTISDLLGSQSSISSDNLLQDSKVLNIMLFGEDNNHGEKYGRTDTMILMSLDNRNKKMKLTSFQRDTYVFIPGHGQNKINASYTLGGAKLSIETIEANFGIKIDRYAIVNFESFKNIIDTLGGVEIEVTQDEIDYINYQMYKNKQVTEYTTIKDKPGLVRLNGQEALWYARNRGLTVGEDGNEIGIDGDDWDRTKRQRKLLEKIFTDMKSADLPTIIGIVSSIGPMITTNLKKDEITALVSHATTYLSYEVVQNYVPQQGLWYYNDYTDVGSVIAISDMSAQRLALAQFVFEDKVAASSSPTTAAQPSTVSADTAVEEGNNYEEEENFE